MADLYKTLYQGQLPSSVGTLYTASGVAAIIKHISIVNNDSSTRTFSLYRNGTAAANIFMKDASIPAGGSIEWDGTMSLESGGTIRGVASVATQLSMCMDGDEVS